MAVFKEKFSILLPYILKFLSLLISLILVRLLVDYLAPTQYGIWLTLNSMVSWFAFMDFGLGNALRNRVIESVADGDYTLARKLITTTYVLVGLISFIILLISLCLVSEFSVAKFLNVSESEYGADLTLIALAMLCCFAGQFVLQLVNVILLTKNLISQSNLLLFCSQGLTLIGVMLLFLLVDNSRLMWSSILIAICTPVSYLMLSIYYFKSSLHDLRPSFRFIDFSLSKDLLGQSWYFFVIQIGQLVMFQTNNIIISREFNPESVTNFNLIYKILSSLLIAYTIFISKIWSSVAQMRAKGRYNEIRNLFFHHSRYFLYFGGVLVLTAILSPFVIHLWVGDNFSGSQLLIFITALQVYFSAFLMLACAFLNGLYMIKTQVLLYLISAVINIPLSIFLGRSIGVEGVLLSNVLLFFVMGTILYYQSSKYIKYGIQN